MGISRRAALKGCSSAAPPPAGTPASAASRSGRRPRTRSGCSTTRRGASAARPAWSACATPTTSTPIRRDLGPDYHAPLDLNERDQDRHQALREDGDTLVHKAQCMHCVDPACATACMLGALQEARVRHRHLRPDLCVGCRYCEMACPFNVPKFEWTKRGAEDRQVRAVPAPHRRRPGSSRPAPRSARATRSSSASASELLRGGQAPHRRRAQPLRPEGLRRDRRRRHPGAVPLARAVREARACRRSATRRRPTLARTVQHGVYRASSRRSRSTACSAS